MPAPLPPPWPSIRWRHGCDLDQQPPLEAQIAAIADDVAYTNHDLDDGLRAGFLALDELAALPLAGAALAEVDRRYPGLEPPRRVHETIRRLIDGMVRDLIDGARRRLASWQPAQPGRRPRPPPARWSRFSPAIGRGPAELREFLRDRVYRHYKVNRMTLKARRVVRELAEALLAAPDCLPDGWRERAGAAAARRPPPQPYGTISPA